MSIRQYLYVLIGQTPVPEPDANEWAEWFHTADRVVFRTQVGASEVSTAFLGVDCQCVIGGPPLLFETAIFTDGKAQIQARCSTWMEAEAQHKRVVETVRVA